MLSSKKIGILGGGQLGKMLCDAAMPWHLEIHVLDKEDHMSAAPYCTHFVKGSFKDYRDVYEFGKDLDIITIEIEHVNLDALRDLKARGVSIYPDPEALYHIVDKGLQKNFYTSHGLPTAPYVLVDDIRDILARLKSGSIQLPFVQKARKEGYDGRGVQTVRTEDDLKYLLDVPSVIEEMVDIEMELALMSARNPSGEIRSFDPVEMVFREGANILDILVSPARVSSKVAAQLRELAEKIIDQLKIVGVLAIEFFLDSNGQIYINEMAPRPHNSGHQTIENNMVSQYEQHLRAVLDWPLAKAETLRPAVMLNLLGEDGFAGDPWVENLKSALQTDGLYLHWYGKAETKAFRKMGHMTLLGDTLEEAIQKAEQIKDLIKVKSK